MQFRVKGSTSSFNKIEPATEGFTDPSTVSKRATETLNGVVIFQLFGKQCASKTRITLSSDGLLTKEMADEYSKTIPQIGKVIESGMNFIVEALKKSAWLDDAKADKITNADVKKLFSHVNNIVVRTDPETKSIVTIVELEGKSPWDEEHGIALKIKNGKVIASGDGSAFY